MRTEHQLPASENNVFRKYFNVRNIKWVIQDTIQKSTGWKIPWKKTCGKTTTEVGRQYQEGLVIAAEHKRMEEMGRGWGYLEANY
jgi:hypothetical protein